MPDPRALKAPGVQSASDNERRANGTFWAVSPTPQRIRGSLWQTPELICHILGYVASIAFPRALLGGFKPPLVVAATHQNGINAPLDPRFGPCLRVWPHFGPAKNDQNKSFLCLFCNKKGELIETRILLTDFGYWSPLPDLFSGQTGKKRHFNNPRRIFSQKFLTCNSWI